MSHEYMFLKLMTFFFSFFNFLIRDKYCKDKKEFAVVGDLNNLSKYLSRPSTNYINAMEEKKRK